MRVFEPKTANVLESRGQMDEQSAFQILELVAASPSSGHIDRIKGKENDKGQIEK